jgi:ATP-binding cassette subfamily B protein
MKKSARRFRVLLSTYLAPFLRYAALLGVLLSTAIALRLVNPIILKSFIDLAASGRPLTDMIRQGVLFLAIAVLLQVLSVLENWMAANLGLLTTNRLRRDLTLHCLGLDMSFHKGHTPGEMIERVDGDVGNLANLFSRFLVEILGSVLLMGGVLVLMYTIDWRVGLAFTVFCAAALAILASLKNIAVPRYRKARQATAELFGFVEERLSGTEDVRANGAVPYVVRGLLEHSRPVWRSWAGANAAGSMAAAVGWILFAVGSALSLALGAALFQRGVITIGTVYLVFGYAGLLTQPIERLVRQLTDLQQAGASAIRILDLLEQRPSIQDTGTRSVPAERPLEVSFQKVSFAYKDDPSAEDPDSTNALSEIHFDLPPGTVLGLLGRTGSGKTTLARLLMRFYEPQQGSLCLGGVSLPDIPVAMLRQRVALVTQDIQLFDATLRENIALFDPSIPDERILSSFEQLGLTDWLAALPEGLETRLAQGGGRLSAGEAQLLAFARVLLRDPGLIVLDEASSRLDPATEARLDRSMQRLLHGRTAIIIAHRLGTVQRADRILILEGGRQVEYGERLQLAQDHGSHFAGLLKTGLEETLA